MDDQINITDGLKSNGADCKFQLEHEGSGM